MSEAIWYIYLVTNVVNGKRYVGQTQQNPATRWKGHVWAARRGAEHCLQEAIRKYGEQCFTLTVVTECYSQREANACERGLIAQYGTWWGGRTGYNMTEGGEGGSRPISAAHKETLRQFATGRRKSPETRAKIAAGHVGKRRAPDDVGKQSATMKRRYAEDPEYLAANVAKLRSPEAIAAYEAYNAEQRRLRKLADEICPRVFFRTRVGRKKPGAPKGYKRSAESIARQRATMALTREARSIQRLGKKLGPRKSTVQALRNQTVA